jgi:hypothetical protein
VRGKALRPADVATAWMPLVIIGIMCILTAYMMEQNCPEREEVQRIQMSV